VNRTKYPTGEKGPFLTCGCSPPLARRAKTCYSVLKRKKSPHRSCEPVEARFGNYAPACLPRMTPPTGPAPVEARFGNYADPRNRISGPTGAGLNVVPKGGRKGWGTRCAAVVSKPGSHRCRTVGGQRAERESESYSGQPVTERKRVCDKLRNHARMRETEHPSPDTFFSITKSKPIS